MPLQHHRSCENLRGGVVSLTTGRTDFQDPNKTKTDVPSENLTEPWELNSRLSTFVTPILYEIILNPDLDKKQFSGQCNITVEVSNATSCIYFHMASLTIEATTVTGGPENATIQHLAAFNYSRHDYWVITFSANLDPGTYVLGLKFSAEMGLKNVGFYESTYLNNRNHKRYMLGVGCLFVWVSMKGKI